MTRIRFLGHATTVIDADDGTRLVTDPVLRSRATGLVHRHRVAHGLQEEPAQAVLPNGLTLDGSVRLVDPVVDERTYTLPRSSGRARNCDSAWICTRKVRPDLLKSLT